MTPLVLTAVLLLGQQLPPLVTAQAPRGRVEGVVLRTGSSEPVVGARVTLSRPNEMNNSTNSSGTNAGNSITLFPVPQVPTLTNGAPLPATPLPPVPITPVFTDNSGRFSFADVEAGTYRLFVQLDGYVRQEYGQRLFPGQGTPLTVMGGDVLKDLTFRLTPAGNVGGRIVDHLGKTAVGVPLQLLKATYNQLGQRTFQNMGSARTNDRGEYRFYWITPGKYYLVGGTPQGLPGSGGGPAGSPNESGDTFAFTFYPGVRETARATAIDVRSGADFVADFIVPRQQLFTIRGRIVDPASALPPPSASLALAYNQLNGGNNNMFSRNPLYNAATGAFELRDVVPGTYLLYVNTLGGSARAGVEVVNANIEGLVLAVNTGVTISGRVSVENGKLPNTNLGLQLRPMVGGSPISAGNFPTIPSVAPEGTFTISNVLPGQYRMGLPPPQDFYVKELRFDRFDALNQAVDIVQRGQDTPTIDIVLSPNVSQIEGMVTDSKAQPVAGVQTVLVPDGNRDRIDLYRTSTTDQNGRFTLRGIAPGDYKVFSWQDLEPNGYFDPDLLRRSEASGKAVRVTESSKQSVNIQVIPGN